MIDSIPISMNYLTKNLNLFGIIRTTIVDMAIIIPAMGPNSGVEADLFSFDFM